MKTKACSGLLESLASLATSQVKSAGIFTIPGLCRIETRGKPATKAGKRMAFGQEIKVKAKPARTIVKAFPVAALKSQICAERSSLCLPAVDIAETWLLWESH